jgi:hypothetical protein
MQTYSSENISVLELKCSPSMVSIPTATEKSVAYEVMESPANKFSIFMQLLKHYFHIIRNAVHSSSTFLLNIAGNPVQLEHTKNND